MDVMGSNIYFPLLHPMSHSRPQRIGCTLPAYAKITRILPLARPNTCCWTFSLDFWVARDCMRFSAPPLYWATTDRGQMKSPAYTNYKIKVTRTLPLARLDTGPEVIKLSQDNFLLKTEFLVLKWHNQIYIGQKYFFFQIVHISIDTFSLFTVF